MQKVKKATNCKAKATNLRCIAKELQSRTEAETFIHPITDAFGVNIWGGGRNRPGESCFDIMVSAP